MAAAATSRTLEVTIISGEDLRLERRQPVKKNTFVTVRTDNSSKSWSTKMDTEGGSYPVWNEKVVVDMPAHARFLTVEVHCKTYSGERVIGGARVPASDFTGGYFPENYLHFLSYRLRDGRGDGNGIINLSVIVKVSESGISNATATCAVAASCSRPWTGVPAGIPVAEKGSGGVVTGVPVRYGY